MAKFKTIITTAGAAKIAAVLAGTASIVLDNIAKMAVGDGGGMLPTPNPSQTKLVNEVHRAPINRASIDSSNPKNIVAELVIPPATGGFWLREMALYDAAGTLLAVGNMAETYKPSLSEGAGRKMVIRMVIAVSEVNAITITMDTATVMATQDYVDSEFDKHAKSRNHPDATLTAKGFTQLSSSTTSASETLAATPKAVKTVMDATNLKAPLASPALTGIPTAPTPAQTVNNTQIATTAFVKAALTALINSSPDVLDTLGELAAALGNDANFATTMTNQLALKAPLSNPALTGKPTAPTAPQASNDTQLATTEFVSRALAPALLMRGELPGNANLNSYGPIPDFIGKWGKYSSVGATIANGFPEDSAVGDVEILPYNQYGGMQRYTVRGGRMYLRNLTGVWNGVDGPWSTWYEVGGLSSGKTLSSAVTSLSDPVAFSQNTTYILSGARSDGPAGLSAGQSNAIIMSLRRAGGTIMGLYQLMFTPVGTYERYGAPNAATVWTSVSWYAGGDANGWRLVGADAMAAIGIGQSNITPYGPFDWQQIDMVTGQKLLTTYTATAWLNTPAGITYNSGTNVDIACVINQANRLVMRLTSNAQTNGNRAEYLVTCTGAKGNRTFTVVQSFNSDSSSVIPIANGGTGSPTPAGARANLGLKPLAVLEGVNNSFPFFDANNAAQLSTITDVGRAVIASDTTADILNYLGVTAALALKAPLASPALTGAPTAPTAAQTVNNTQIATTAFVKAAIAALVNSSPAALDTLKELADALGNDANFAATMTNALAGKQPIDPTLTTLAALVGSANSFPYFTGGDTAALATLTSFARTLLSRSDADGVLADIGLGRVATSADIQAGTVKKIVDAAGMKAFLPKRSFAANDFIRIPDVPGGLIIQWGTVAKSTPEGVQNVIFPTPFPNFSLMAIATPSNLSGNNGIDVFSQVGAISNSDVNFYFSWVSTATPADGFRWFALGF